MDDHRRSYWKTVVVASILAAGGTFVLGWLLWTAQPVVAVGIGLASGALVGWASLVVAGGLIALRRDTLETLGAPYATREPREWVAGPLVGAVRAVIRRIAHPWRGRPDRLDLRPGESVEVKDLDAILRTLDDRGTLDGVPFMPEMGAFCGGRFRVLRRVEKLNDWVGHTGLRRVRNTVLLERLRCTGAAHAGCQAGCHLRWKEAWLRRVATGRRMAETPAATDRVVDLERLAQRVDEAGAPRFVCQATELAAGTTPLAWGDPRHRWRDWVRGNVRLRPFLTGVALACFNWTQRRRGGVSFPFLVLPAQKTSPDAGLGLQAGDRVRVKSKREIEPTLTEGSRNRGLWFDVEMLRHCGGEYRVATRVERLIDERTGRLRQLATPCIILEGVTATGEYTAFNPENESILWREIWLTPVRPQGRTATSA